MRRFPQITIEVVVAPGAWPPHDEDIHPPLFWCWCKGCRHPFLLQSERRLRGTTQADWVFLAQDAPAELLTLLAAEVARNGRDGKSVEPIMSDLSTVLSGL